MKMLKTTAKMKGGTLQIMEDKKKKIKIPRQIRLKTEFLVGFGMALRAFGNSARTMRALLPRGH